MRRVFPRIVLALVIVALVWWVIDGRAPSRQSAMRQGPPVAPAALPDDATAGLPLSPPVEEVKAAPAREARPPGSDRERRAFRFVLSGGKLGLEAVDDIEGDFHPRRGLPAWQEGMLCCRLLDDQRRVLAEETVPAPDRVCVVLDPHTAGIDGAPTPAVLSPPGPFVFQVRLPRMDSATQMKVYRIAGKRPLGPDEEPAGQLLATIPLAR